MNKYYGLILSSIAGLSTLIGYFFIYVKGSREKIISIALSFAGGAMITLSIIDLLPSSIENLIINNSYKLSIFCVLLFFFIGFFTSHLLEKLLNKYEGLYKTGIISMIAIIIHNIPEGIATYVLGSIDLKLGIILTVAIILHNIPEGIGISIPIYYSTYDKKKAFIYTLISGISEPVGALLSMMFLNKYIDTNTIGILFSFISGLMIYIGYNEMIKISKKDFISNVYLLLGSLIILIVEILLKY